MTTKVKLNQIYPVPASASNSELTGTPTAPTPATNDDSTKIATTAYVKSNCSNYLPLTGGIVTGKVTINKDSGTGPSDGSLTITGSRQNYAIQIQTGAVTKGTAPASTLYNGIEFYGTAMDTFSNRLAILEHKTTTGNVNSLCMIAYNLTSATNTNTCTISCNVDASGNAYTYAPTPATTDNSTKIATTAFVKAQGCNVDSSSIGTDGYIRFTNGLQLQWGQVNQNNSSSDAGTSVTFTKAFSSEPRIFVDTSWGGKYKMTLGLQVFNRSATGFSVISPSYNGTNLVYDTGGISWFAIGPWS